MRHALSARAGLVVLTAVSVLLDGAAAEAATVGALTPVRTLLTPSRLFGIAILAPTLLLAIGSLASFLMDLLRRNQDH